MVKRRVDCIAGTMSRWQITPEEYEDIYSTFQTILQETGILGERMQGTATRRSLKDAIGKMLKVRRHRHILARLDQSTVQNDLRRMAQQLSRNHRRRAGRLKERQARESATDSNKQRTPHHKQSAWMPVGNETNQVLSPASSTRSQSARPSLLQASGDTLAPTSVIVIRRYDEEEGIIYRLSDFCFSENHKTAMVRIDDLAFGRFVKTLTKDIAYVPDEDVISYECQDVGKLRISSEQIWRAALWDMHNQGERRLRFEVQRKSEKRTRAGTRVVGGVNLASIGQPLNAQYAERITG